MSAEPTPAPDQLAELHASLGAAGFRRGEVFELARLTGDERNPREPWRGNDTAAAAAWVAAAPTNVYLVLNPIRAGVRSRFAKVADMATARTLYLDLDPKPDRAAAEALARDLERFLVLRLGVEGCCSVIDSGRGRGLLLHHEPMPPEMSHDSRKLLLEGLSWRFRDVAPGAYLDPTPFSACASARVAGSVNGKTGERVRVLARATAAVPWIKVAELALELKKDLPPPKEGPRKLPEELRAAVAALAASVEDHRDELQRQAWEWVGAGAGRRGVHDLVADAIPAPWQASFRSAAATPQRRWTRPDGEPLRKQLERALDLVASGAGRAAKVAEADRDVQIERLVCRTEGKGRRSRFDVTLRVGSSTFEVSSVDGKTLLSYTALRAHAAESHCLLPGLGKDAGDLWEKKLRAAWDKQVIVEEHGTTYQAVQQAIRAGLRKAKKQETQKEHEWRSGGWARHETMCAVPAEALVAQVRALMKDDLVSREAIADAARALGADLGVKVLLAGDTGPVRRRAWAFPLALQGEDD